MQCPNAHPRHAHLIVLSLSPTRAVNAGRWTTNVPARHETAEEKNHTQEISKRGQGAPAEYASAAWRARGVPHIVRTHAGTVLYDGTYTAMPSARQGDMWIVLAL